MDRSGAPNRDQLRGIAHRAMTERVLLPDSLKASMAGQPAHYLENGAWVRIPEPSVEGKVVRGSQGLDVGDHGRVELVDTDVERGFIDLRRASG